MQLDGAKAARRYDDYSILRRTKASGDLVGVFHDQPIYEQVIDEYGRAYSYVGLAPLRRDGSFDVGGLGPGEFVLPPGLLYRSEESRKK